MFIMIPYKVETDHELHPNSKLLMGIIISLNKGNLGCIASNKYFAKRLNVQTIRTVQRYLETLKAKDYIKIESFTTKQDKEVRVIVPTANILVDINTAVSKQKERQNRRGKNLLPTDIESDWLNDYLDSL